MARRAGSRAASTAGAGNSAVTVAARAGERLAVRGHQPPGGGARGGERDLLAQDGAHGELGAVDGAGHPQPRRGADQRTEERVGAEVLGDDARVGVEVEQPPAALRGRRAVACVLEPQAAAHAVGVERELDHARPARQAQAAPVDVAVDLLDAGDRAHGQPGQQRLGGERRAEGQLQREVAVAHRRTVARRRTSAR